MALVVAMQGDQSRTARGVAPGAAPLSPSPYWFEEAIVSSGRSRSSFPAAPYSRSRPPFPPDVIIGIRAIPLSPLARLPIGNGRSRRRPRHGSSTRIASVLPSFAAAVLPGEDSASPVHRSHLCHGQASISFIRHCDDGDRLYGGSDGSIDAAIHQRLPLPWSDVVFTSTRLLWSLNGV